MIKIAICDDEISELKRVKGYISEYLENHLSFEVYFECFLVPFELLNHIEKHGAFDIYILDVYMAGMLGTEVAKQLRSINEDGEIIFITSSLDHALTAFEVGATDYLLKPFDKVKLFKTLDKIIERLNLDENQIITLKTSQGIERININDVLYSETSRNNYQNIYTIKGNRLTVRMSTTELFEILSQQHSFTKCGASINLNLRYVRQIKRDMIIFNNGLQITYPYRIYKKLEKEFLQYQFSNNN